MCVMQMARIGAVSAAAIAVSCVCWGKKAVSHAQFHESLPIYGLGLGRRTLQCMAGQESSRACVHSLAPDQRRSEVFLRMRRYSV